MRKPITPWLTVAAGAAFALSAQAPAHAANINTGGVVCQKYHNPNAPDLDYGASGVTNNDANFRSIVCALPRSPVAANATAGFYIDGDNFSGASTSCTLFSYNYNGTFLGSAAFVSSALHYDNYLSLAANISPTYAYATLLCTLPPNSNGVLRGLTSLQ